MFHQSGTRRFIYNSYNPICLNFKGFVVGAIFLRLLRHKSYIWYGSHSSGIKSPMFLTELYSGLVDICITTIRNYCFRILPFSF